MAQEGQSGQNHPFFPGIEGNTLREGEVQAGNTEDNFVAILSEREHFPLMMLAIVSFDVQDSTSGRIPFRTNRRMPPVT